MLNRYIIENLRNKSESTGTNITFGGCLFSVKGHRLMIPNAGEGMGLGKSR